MTCWILKLVWVNVCFSVPKGEKRYWLLSSPLYWKTNQNAKRLIYNGFFQCIYHVAQVLRIILLCFLIFHVSIYFTAEMGKRCFWTPKVKDPLIIVRKYHFAHLWLCKYYCGCWQVNFTQLIKLKLKKIRHVIHHTKRTIKISDIWNYQLQF